MGMVEGEEDLLKAIISWEAVPGANPEYEVCVDCDISAGARNGNAGELAKTSATRGGKPSFIRPGMPKGSHTFHVRANVKGEWTLWSDPRKYNIQTTGSHSEEL